MISLAVRLPGVKCATLAFALGSLSPALFAQDALTRQIDFVRALAKEMQFIELAKSEADRLATAYRGAGDQDKIAQLAVEVSYYGARSRSNRAEQRSLFKETVDKSQELIDRSTDVGVKLQAMSTLASASQDFGQFLIEELDIARSENPESVKDLQAEAIEVLRAGKDACSSVKEALESERSDPQKQVEYFLMWMKQAVLTREQGKADKENRGVLVDRAIEELEEMVLDSGEESALGLRGLFEIAQCYEVKGEIAEAITWYTDTIEQITTSLTSAQEGDLELSGEIQGFLFGMMQEVYLRAGETMAREGADGTDKLFADFRSHIAKFGEEGVDIFDVVSPSFGHLMLLAESRHNAESGDSAKVQAALAMAQRINDKHPADYVGLRAKSVLSDILAVQQGLVSGALLFEVGKGDLQNKKYETAIKGLRQAIAAMTKDESKELGLEAYKMLGAAYRRTDRHLESILAMSEGLKAFGIAEASAKSGEDKIRAESSSDVADSLDRAVSSHKRQTKEDAFFSKIWTEMINLAAIYSSGGANKLAFKTGNKFFSDKQFADAVTEFAKITADYVYYEQARVRMARAQKSAGDFSAARATTAEYRKFVTDNELNPRETGRLSVRKAAQTAAAYNDVQMAYYEARGSEAYKLERNLKNYTTAVASIQSFITNHRADGGVYVPQVLAYLGRLHVDTGALDEAEQAYVQLKDKDAAQASRLASEIFQEYQRQVAGQVSEVEDAIKSNETTSAINAAKEDVDVVRRKLTALGTDYINGSPRPQLAILVNTMLNWQELGEWQRVDDVAKKTLSLYGDIKDQASKRVIDLTVRPMVGEALLQQKRFQEAYDMLVEAEAANPTQWELKRQVARALGGWFEFSNTGQAVSVKGLDEPIKAYQKYYGDPKESYRVWATRPDVAKFSLEWYRFMWESYWFAKQAGEKDSKYRDIARKFYRISRSTNNFATLKEYGIAGANLFAFFQANQVLR